MAYTSTVRRWWASYRCTPGIKVSGGFFGRTPVLAANEDVVEAIRAIEQGHLGSGYVPTSGGYIGSKRRCPSGIGGKTCQEDGTNCSLHNYCIALDIEYNYNRYIHARIYEADFAEDWFPSICKYTLDQVRAIEGIKNEQGEQMWLWLGWAIGDTMHWQLNVPPSRMSVDWNTVPEGGSAIPGDDDMLQKGDKGKRVERAQERLIAIGYPMPQWGADGSFGDETLAAVKAYQTDRDLDVDGVLKATDLAMLFRVSISTNIDQTARDSAAAAHERLDDVANVLTE